MKTNIKNQKGFSLFITIVFMAIMLSIVVGLDAILFNQLKTLTQAGNSVIAFYAADAGSEFIQNKIKFDMASLCSDYSSVGAVGSCPAPALAASPNAGYSIEVVCCDPVAHPAPDCLFDATFLCPAGLSSDPNCGGKLFCSKITGVYNNTRRVIETEN